MHTIVLIFKIIVAIACLVVMFGMPIYFVKVFQKRTRKIPGMSTEELKEMAAAKPTLYCNSVVKELLSRNEDISFAMPLFLRLACERNQLRRLIGWAGLKEYFSKQLPAIDFTEERPSRNTIDQLKLINKDNGLS